MKLILSYDESQKIGQHISNMKPFIFEYLRIEDDGNNNNLHICFAEYDNEEDDNEK